MSCLHSGLVGRIAELLESIDSKLDKVNIAPIPTDDTPELMNVKDLGRYLPSHPAPSTVYSWVNDNTIPYYKQGKTKNLRNSGKHTIKVPEVINSAANQRKRSGKFIANARGKLIATRSVAVFLGVAAEL